jgi:hypothetical protein
MQIPNAVSTITPSPFQWLLGLFSTTSNNCSSHWGGDGSLRPFFAARFSLSPPLPSIHIHSSFPPFPFLGADGREGIGEGGGGPMENWRPWKFASN